MEFPNLGSHCSFSECKQLDFLPFSCSCGEKFCLTHRLPLQHNCPVRSDANLVPTVVVFCPICSKQYKLFDFEDPDQVINAHMQMAQCRPKKEKSVKCIAKGCQVKAPNSLIQCTVCKQNVCLK